MSIELIENKLGKLKGVVSRTSTVIATAAISAALASPMASAALPAVEAPSGGTATGGLMTNLQLYLKEYGALIGLVVCVVAFIIVAVSGIASFHEATKKGEWSKFGITVTVGIILIVVIIWLANKAAAIL